MTEKLSEKVAQLEQENTQLRKSWCYDLNILCSLAERLGDIRVKNSAKACLVNLRRK